VITLHIPDSDGTAIMFALAISAATLRENSMHSTDECGECCARSALAQVFDRLNIRIDDRMRAAQNRRRRAGRAPETGTTPVGADARATPAGHQPGYGSLRLVPPQSAPGC